MGEQSDKVLIVSCDGHASALIRDYRPYVESKYLEDFDRYVAAYEAATGGARFTQPKFLFAPPEIEPYLDYMIESGAIDGEFDANLRMKELGTQGIVAEVLFPQPTLPFYEIQYSSGSEFLTREMTREGERAYNRWLADFVSEHPQQIIGQAIVSFDDIDEAVATVVWAKEHGLRGVVLPNVRPGASVLHWDPALDVLWSVIEDSGMVANFHPAGDVMEFYPCPEGLDILVPGRIVSDEFPYFSHRALGRMMWSGVFERHPRLRVVFTEQYADWLPGLLKKWDWLWSKDDRYQTRRIEIHPRKPSEYWAQNCWIGSSLTSRAEMEHRHEIGIDKFMFGADFPHVEGSYPRVLATLQTLCADVPDGEIRKYLGLNAAALWDLDLDALAPMVDEVGFTIDELRQSPPPSVDLGFDVHRPY